jgi:hypothetical protein
VPVPEPACFPPRPPNTRDVYSGIPFAAPPHSPAALLPPCLIHLASEIRQRDSSQSISGAASASNVHHHRPKDIPPQSTSQPHLHHPRARSLSVLPGQHTSWLRHTSVPRTLTLAAHETRRNCGSNTCRPLRTRRRRATSTPTTTTYTRPPSRQPRPRLPLWHITRPTPPATLWPHPPHPPP